MPNLTALDWLILLLYFVFVVGIGFALRARIKTGKEFLEAGRSLPAWICGLAFLAAGVGAPEVIGMGALGARYGLQAVQFFLIGAIPAMLFAGLFMMPLYYGSGARTVPGFLGLRFDARTRTLNACLFAAAMVASAGISLCIMARALQALHLFDRLFRALDWPPQGTFALSIVFAAAIVLAYVLFGGLRGAMYNQALQFLLLVAGFLPMVWLGLRSIGGWSGLQASLPTAYMHPWKGGLDAASNPMGLSGVAIAVGVGLVLGAGCWCTDFRAIQAALAAKDMDSARRTPLIAAIPRLFLPFLLVLPGLLAIGLPTPRTSTEERILGGAIVRTTTVVRPEVEAGQGLVPARVDAATGKPLLNAAGEAQLNYPMATPAVLLRFLPAGLLGLGLTALLACLMSGMAASLTAFNAVFTRDLYQPCARPGAADGHYLAVGRWAALGGVLLSVGMAFAASRFDNIFDPLVLVFSVAAAPLSAVVLLGMFWKRATGHGAFSGLIAGAAAALLHHGLTLPAGALPGIEGGWMAVVHRYPTGLAQGVGTAMAAFAASFIATVLVSFCSQARPEAELVGLVHSLTPRPRRARGAWWKRPEALAAAILLAAIALCFLLV